MKRLKRFINRFRNQYKIHKNWAFVWMIMRMAWIQSKPKYNKKPIIKKIPISKLEDID